MRLAAAVSPEDGALHQQVLLHNQGQRAVQVEVTGCFALALCGQGDMQAHPAFQNLFPVGPCAPARRTAVHPAAPPPWGKGPGAAVLPQRPPGRGLQL